MMIRKAQERGAFRNEWLDTHYTFSFAEYFDPRFMGFHDLRVINDDIVAPASGFPTHGHRDMEIITYVTAGAVAHRDSMGNVETLRAGEVQVMSAGRGVLHSEYNPSAEEPLKLLQIWIKPGCNGLQPAYAQRPFAREEKLNRLCLVASPDAPSDGALKINQDARLYASVLEAGHDLRYILATGRAAWLHVVNGKLAVNGKELETGDGLGLEAAGELKLESRDGAEFLLFDLARRSGLNRD